MYESNDEMVSHPSHYQSATGLEVIDVIEAFTADLKGIEATDTGNVIKYILRWKHKNGLQDLEKAKWYLTHLIEKITERNRNVEHCEKCIESYKEVDSLPPCTTCSMFKFVKKENENHE